jgi:hypothetical protein
MRRGGPQGTLALAKGGPKEIFQKFKNIEKLLQTNSNFLKIIENLSCDQNNFFRSIKTWFKKFRSDA